MICWSLLWVFRCEVLHVVLDDVDPPQWQVRHTTRIGPAAQGTCDPLWSGSQLEILGPQVANCQAFLSKIQDFKVTSNNSSCYAVPPVEWETCCCKALVLHWDAINESAAHTSSLQNLKWRPPTVRSSSIVRMYSGSTQVQRCGKNSTIFQVFQSTGLVSRKNLDVHVSVPPLCLRSH